MPRVLVVDDQPDVRTTISIMLRVQRYEVVEAASAASALGLFEQGSFDLAIIDMFLQDSNGSDLIAALRARSPGLPVVAISGMAALDSMPGFTDVARLLKPFRPQELMRAIEEARSAHRQSADALMAAG